MRKLEVKGPSTPKEIEEAYKASRGVHERERLLAIELGQKGKYSIAQIGEILGRGRRTIARWIAAYREGGIEQLLERRYEGRKPRLSPEEQSELLEGLRTGKWKSAKQILRWLAEKGVGLKQGSIYYWLDKLKGSWKVPRKSHIKKDPEAEKKFKQEIVQKLETLEIAPDKEVRIWVEDEHRYGLISIIRRCWMLRGQRVKVPYQTKYQWGYVYGALEVMTGAAEFFFTPTVSLRWTDAFLQQLVATAPEAIHILIWDGAGFHPKENIHQLPPQLRLLPLPPYCPESNPVEPLWNIVKREEANAAWPTLDIIEEVISQALTPFWQQTEKVLSFLGISWLTLGAASFLARRLNANSS